MNSGVLASEYAPPLMPRGLLGSPTPLEMIDAYGYDADARRYIRAVEAADGHPLELAVRVAVNDFVVGCKRDGTWSAVLASCILMGARTLAGALVPLAGAAPTNANFVSGDYSRKTGLKGNQSNKSLLVTPSNNLQDSFSLSAYVSESPTMTDGRSVIGALTGGVAGATRIRLRSSPSVEINNRATPVNSFSTAGTLRVGFVGSSRSFPASYVGRINGSNTTVNVASSFDAAATNYAVFATTSSNAASGWSDPRLAWFHFGERLEVALLDARVSALYAAIGAAIP